MIEITIFIVASENTKNLNVTSLQLVTVDCSSCFKSCYLSKASPFPKLQTNDSLKKPCSIPK